MTLSILFSADINVFSIPTKSPFIIMSICVFVCVFVCLFVAAILFCYTSRGALDGTR